ERATTIATSLDAERDRGNIFKTQSKATPNEPGSQGTSSSGGPKCQEAMGDSFAQREYLKFLMTHCSQELTHLEVVCLSARVESFKDEGLGKKDASKQGRITDIDANEDIILGRIADIDANEDITLVSTHDEQMFDADQDLGGEEEQKLAGERAQQDEEANIALIESWDDVQAKNDADYQLAERLQAKEQQELNGRKSYIVYATLRENKETAGEELEQENAKKQKIDDDKDTTKLKQLVKIIPDEEGVAIDAIPLDVKPPSIVDWEIQKEGKRSYYKIIKADGSSKIYLIFSHMLKDFDREDVETLWKLVKAKYGSTRPEGEYERVLWGDLKVMFEPHIEEEVWKMQQRYNVVRWTLFNSCRVHCLSQ
nr:hypothetical protein [Tanacetum cinerariifolium]